MSVVIATYGWSSALRTSIPSVLAQTCADLELIVVGDGCDDDTRDVVAEFTDARIRWDNLPSNTGSQSSPNNRGNELARGRYVAYLGQDDVWHPTHLQRLVEAIESADADLAYSVAILYGEPGSGIRGVTGLAPHDAAGPMHFTPPSSILHRADLVDAIGPWRDHRTIHVPQDYDLQLRAWEHRGRFASTSRATVFKFTAGWRADAYAIRDVSEQEACLRRLRSEPDFIERELLDVVRAYQIGAAVPVGAPPESETAGAGVDELRAHKGVAAFADEELREELVYRMDLPHRGILEWFALEHHRRHGAFRWTGPNERASIRLPVAPGRDREVRVHVINALDPSLLDTLWLEVNGTDIPLRVDRTSPDPHEGWFTGTVPAATLDQGLPGARLTFGVARTVAPIEVDPLSDDQRRLGVAISEISFGPAEGAAA